MNSSSRSNTFSKLIWFRSVYLASSALIFLPCSCHFLETKVTNIESFETFRQVLGSLCLSVTCFHAYICARMQKHQTETCGSRSVCVCVCVCRAGMWFTLVVFDVSIRGLPPSTSTLLFDLHQSGPDHSAFVYFQRHFSFLLVSVTPAHPLSLTVATLVACVCARVCAGLSVFCSHGQTQKRPACFTSVWLLCAWSFLSSFSFFFSFFFPLNKSEEKHNFCAGAFSYGPD